MPNVFTAFGCRFYFFSNEGMPREPLHIHVSKDHGACKAKFWIDENGVPSLDSSEGFSSKELKGMTAIITASFDEIKEAWKKHFEEEPTYKQ